jgi:hypothetical protein
VSKPSETITIQVMSISGNAPEWRISLIVCVSKRFFFLSINQFRDGAVSDRLVENVIQNISRLGLQIIS